MEGVQLPLSLDGVRHRLPLVANLWTDAEPSELRRVQGECALRRRCPVVRALRLVKRHAASDCRAALRIVLGIAPHPFADWRAADQNWRARLPESRRAMRAAMREAVQV